MTEQNWRDETWVAFDTETTGAYPVGSEICELAAVKWQNGEIVDSFQTLLRPAQPMSDFIIGIHGITNEMVSTAPKFEAAAPAFLKFIEGSILIAHHAQFDLGFLAEQLERSNLILPQNQTLCSSLLAQATISGVENHKLQTLARHFKVDSGTAHRALDDARTCLEVTLKIITAIESCAASPYALSAQKLGSMMKSRTQSPMSLLNFERFSIEFIERQSHLSAFVHGARRSQPVELTYRGGSRPGQARPVQPLGVIRQIDGDSFVAHDLSAPSMKPKKFWIDQVERVVSVDSARTLG